MKVTNLMLIAAVLSGLESAADTLIWTGAYGMSWNATTQSWQTPGGSPAAWVAGSDAVFNGSGTGRLSLDKGLSARTLTIDGAGANYQFDCSTDLDEPFKDLYVSGKIVTITNGATLALNAAINRFDGNANKDVTFNVSKGSTLKILKKAVDGEKPVFNIDGGTLNVVDNQQITIQYLNLGNGALVTDPTDGDGNSQTFRIGGSNVPRPWIRSEGPAGATNEIRANITVWDKNVAERAGTDHRLMIEVGEQPLLMTGRFFGPCNSDTGAYNAHRIDKVGSGTLIMRCNGLTPDGSATFGTANTALRPSVLTAAVHVVEGTLRCETNSVFLAGRQHVVVGGGTNGVATLDLIFGWQNCRLTVLSNGVARMAGSKVLRTSPVTVDGGILRSAHQNNFLCDLTLRNGGIVEGDEHLVDGTVLRIGSAGAAYKYPTIRSEGSGTNEIKNILRFYRCDSATDLDSQAIVFDVTAPLRLHWVPRGPTVGDESSVTRHTWKVGPGELILNYAVSEELDGHLYSPGVLTVKEGSLRLAKSLAMRSGMNLELVLSDRTALAVSAGTVNAVKKTTFAGEVTLDIGDQAELSFVAYDLSGLTTLNMPSSLGATALRFGTTKCLTDAELAKFNCRGYLFEQDENGYIHSHKRGIVLIFR